MKNLSPERFIRQMNIRCTKKSRAAVTAILRSKKFSNEPYISGLLFNILSLLPQVLRRRIYNSISSKEILKRIKIPISSTSNFFPRSPYEPSKLDERRKYVNIRTRISTYSTSNTIYISQGIKYLGEIKFCRSKVARWFARKVCHATCMDIITSNERYNGGSRELEL